MKSRSNRDPVIVEDNAHCQVFARKKNLTMKTQNLKGEDDDKPLINGVWKRLMMAHSFVSPPHLEEGGESSDFLDISFVFALPLS